VGIVLGSGLAGLADAVERPVVIPYAQVPGVPEPTVPGHRGEFVAGTLEGVPVILQRGRLHLYEGHDPATAVFPVRLMAGLGVEMLVVTNAAGGIRASITPPALMLISDHLNLTGRSPLMGPAPDGEPRFPDMSAAYDPALRALAREVARDAGVTLHEGVYAGLLGPSFETPAEIRMLATLGADAVGMSTVLEVIAARARGLRVLGISTITNPAAGITDRPLDHEEVLEAGRAVARDLEALVRGVLRGLERR
jgi:purine-nucleoside phosphorylase